MSKGKITKKLKDGEQVGWQYRWRDPQGRQHRKSFARKSAAETFAADIESAIRDNTYVDPTKGKEAFGDFALRYHRGMTGSHNYRAHQGASLRVHILPVLGDMQIDSITDEDIKGLIEALTAKGLKVSTVRLHMTLVRTIFKAAVRKKVIRDNPCVGVPLPKGGAPKVRPLEPIQVRSLIANFAPRYRALILLAAASGARQGELFGLRVGDLNWDEGSASIHIQRQLVVEDGNGVVEHPTKNHDDRVIPVPAEVLDMVIRHIAEFPPEPGGYLFTMPGNKPIHARSFRARPWAQARKAAAGEFTVMAAAASNASDAVKNTIRAQQMAVITMHQLRDYYASLLISQGVSVSIVSERLGHADQTTTLRHYAHLWAGHEDLTREVIGKNLLEIAPDVPVECPTDPR